MSPLPPITVFMPVYNGLKYLPEAVQSILEQSFRHFEFLIIDDGSTDGSLEYLRELRDPRIRLIAQSKNIGLRANYNFGLAEAQGEYIAIMDQDDIAMPQRLERQWHFMQAHPEVGLCGGEVETFGELQAPSWVRYSDHEDIKVALLFESPICHSTVMLRSEVLREHHLNYPDCPYAEDYGLWVAMSRVTLLANLPEVLLRYRTHQNQVSIGKSEIQNRSASKIISDQLAELGIKATTRQLAVHKRFGSAFNPIIGSSDLLHEWQSKIIIASHTKNIYSQIHMKRQLAERLVESTSRNSSVLSKMSLLRRLHWKLGATYRYYRTPNILF